MDRLTERDEFGNADIIGVDSGSLQMNLELDELNTVTDALNRLAVYEDTGLTPERVQELARAESEGRLVVLPCKVGSSLYHVGESDGDADIAEYHIVHRYGIGLISEDGTEHCNPTYWGIDGIEYGLKKGYFYRTREEAEAALEGKP